MGGGSIKRNCQETGEPFSNGSKTRKTVVECFESSDSRWSFLPREILDKILALLDVKSMKAASNVCEYWKDVLNENKRFSWFHGKECIERGHTKLTHKTEILFVDHQLCIMRVHSHVKKGEYHFQIIDDRVGRTWDIVEEIDLETMQEGLLIDDYIIVGGKASESLIALDFRARYNRNRILKIWSRKNRNRLKEIEKTSETKVPGEERILQYWMHQSTILIKNHVANFSASVVKEDGTVNTFKFQKDLCHFSDIVDFCFPHALVSSGCRFPRRIGDFVTGGVVDYSVVKFSLSEENVKEMCVIKKTFDQFIAEKGDTSGNFPPSSKLLPPSYVVYIKYDEQFKQTFMGDKVYVQIWSVRISDFSGNTIFKIEHRFNLEGIPRSMLKEGYEIRNLKVDVRKGIRRLFFKKSDALVTLDFDSILGAYKERGEVVKGEDVYNYNNGRRLSSHGTQLIANYGRAIGGLGIEDTESKLTDHYVEEGSVKFFRVKENCFDRLETVKLTMSF